MLKQIINKIWRPKSTGLVHTKKLEIPEDFFYDPDLEPKEVLTTSGMEEIFRFSNSYQDIGGEPEVIVVGSKDSDIYFARAFPGPEKRIRGQFVLEMRSLKIFCEKLEGLLTGEWDDSWGTNMVYRGKDRILMTTSYPREVPMVWFTNHRNATIDGERTRWLTPTITTIEARFLLAELKKLTHLGDLRIV